MKKKDPINDNDAVAFIFGPGALTQFRYFNDFFGVVSTRDCATL